MSFVYRKGRTASESNREHTVMPNRYFSNMRHKCFDKEAIQMSLAGSEANTTPKKGWFSLNKL